MLALEHFAKTALLEWVSFDLIYLKITANKILVSFLLAFRFQVLSFVSSSLSYTHVFRHSVLKIEKTPENVSAFFNNGGPYHTETT